MSRVGWVCYWSSSLIPGFLQVLRLSILHENDLTWRQRTRNQPLPPFRCVSYLLFLKLFTYLRRFTREWAPHLRTLRNQQWRLCFMCEAVSCKCFSFKDAWCAHCVKPMLSTPNTSTPFSKNETKHISSVTLPNGTPYKRCIPYCLLSLAKGRDPKVWCAMVSNSIFWT